MEPHYTENPFFEHGQQGKNPQTQSDIQVDKKENAHGAEAQHNGQVHRIAQDAQGG